MDNSKFSMRQSCDIPNQKQLKSVLQKWTWVQTDTDCHVRHCGFPCVLLPCLGNVLCPFLGKYLQHSPNPDLQHSEPKQNLKRKFWSSGCLQKFKNLCPMNVKIIFKGVQKKGCSWNTLARKKGEIWASYNRYKNLSQNGSLSKFSMRQSCDIPNRKQFKICSAEMDLGLD